MAKVPLLCKAGSEKEKVHDALSGGVRVKSGGRLRQSSVGPTVEPLDLSLLSPLHRRFLIVPSTLVRVRSNNPISPPVFTSNSLRELAGGIDWVERLKITKIFQTPHLSLSKVGATNHSQSLSYCRRHSGRKSLSASSLQWPVAPNHASLSQTHTKRALCRVETRVPILHSGGKVRRPLRCARYWEVHRLQVQQARRIAEGLGPLDVVSATSDQ